MHTYYISIASYKGGAAQVQKRKAAILILIIAI